METYHFYLPTLKAVPSSQEFPHSLPAALQKHYLIMQTAVESNNGFVFKTVGDAFCCSFDKAGDALRAAVDSQLHLSNEKWDDAVIKVRMGIHSEYAVWDRKEYVGHVTLARAERIMSAAHGGQILISINAYLTWEHELNVDNSNSGHNITFRDMGERRLKDLNEPVKLYQIVSNKLVQDFPLLKTLDVRPNNLPIQLTSFIGRETEMKEIKKILNTSRLITLLGPGGTGKTRLAIQAAADVIDQFVNGVWLIELASLSNPALIYNVIASALNIREDSGRKLSDVICNYLKEKEMLIILDNCEHMIDDCALISEELLSKCPGIKIITTGRQPLRITGEILLMVSTLSMPETSENVTAEHASRFEAIRLFIDRAVAVKKDFTVDNENAPALAELCNHLDGIPLAIELAAARIKILSVEKILDKISNRFQLLTGGSRTALPRQQTLRALIDWSYDLLSEKEKLFFARLSVFSGGWSMEAAEAVCVGDDIEDFEVLDLISNLIDKSIIISKEKNGIIRYDMFESIRQYSSEKLHTKDEICLKHFEYFFKLSGEHDPLYDHEKEKVWKKTMETEQDNLRIAIKWSLENCSERSPGLVMNTAEYWELVGNNSEAFDALRKILELNIEIDPKVRATAYLNAAFMANTLDDNETAENYVIKGLEYSRSNGNKAMTAEALSIYGIISYVKGDTENGIKYSEESLSLIEGQNEKILEANVRGNLGAYYAGTGNIEMSLKLLDEAIGLYSEINKKEFLAKLIISKGGVYLQSGDLEKAGKCFEEALPLLEEVNDQNSVGITLYNPGNLNFTLKKYSETVDFYKASMAKSKEYGNSGTYDRSYIKLGEIALIENESEKAKNIFVECLKSFNKDSEKLKLSLSIFGLGKYYFHEKSYEIAARLFFLAERINEATKFKLSKSRLEENEHIISEFKNKIHQDKFTALYDEALSYDLDKAAEIALAMSNEQ